MERARITTGLTNSEGDRSEFEPTNCLIAAPDSLSRRAPDKEEDEDEEEKEDEDDNGYGRNKKGDGRENEDGYSE
ncbi:MAG TPA: hypothetical protein VF135_06985 [Terriglobales bacterium]